MKRRNIAIMAMLVLTAGQAFAQRCLPQMKGIEVKVGMADGVYNGKKSCKAGYYAGLGLSSYTKGGDKWTYGAEYLQVNQPYRNTSVPIAQMTGELGYSYNFLSDNSKTVLFYIGGTALAGYESVNWGKRTMSDGATLQNKGAFIYGGAVALETEIYLSDAIALTASVKKRLVWGNSTGHFHTQFGIGMKFIIN